MRQPSSNGHLDRETFKVAVEFMPLVSIDLVIVNRCNEILLGYRNNRPARNFWFVPGGRIRKGETLDVAFARVTEIELSRVLSREDAHFLGVFEHFYDDSVFGEAPGTHYVVLAYHLQLGWAELDAVNSQHRAARWWPAQEIRQAPDVHPYTKAYVESLLGSI